MLIPLGMGYLTGISRTGPSGDAVVEEQRHPLDIIAERTGGGSGGNGERSVGKNAVLRAKLVRNGTRQGYGAAARHHMQMKRHSYFRLRASSASPN